MICVNKCDSGTKCFVKAEHFVLRLIYRILDSNGVPRRPKVRGVRKIFVTIEEDVAAILDKEQSVSLYVNEAIRFYHSNRH